MKTNPQDHFASADSQELLDLIGSVLNATASEEEKRRLNDWLLRDATARRAYRRYINVHATLHSNFASSASASKPLTENHTDSPFIRKQFGRLIPIAVAASIVIVVSWFIAKSFNPSHEIVQHENARPSAHNAVGHVSKVSNARWGQDRGELVIDAAINAGPIDLSEGIAELTLKNGVRMVLEAPVRFDLEDTGKLKLQHGRLVAYVPQEARGFAVSTPHSRVVDLGTEFGVAVGDAGETEVQVFSGEVVTQVKGPRDSVLDQHLAAGKALMIDASATSRGIPYQPERFVRMFPEENLTQPAGQLYNVSKCSAVNVLAARSGLTIDGSLADWDRSGAFHGECVAPYQDSHYVDGMMMYDDKFLYIGAHVGDPAPMLSKMNPDADPQQYSWLGGSVIVRLVTDPKLGWPYQGMGPAERNTEHRDYGKRPEDISEKVVHLTMWYHQPTNKPRLQISYGMDFHGENTKPLTKDEAKLSGLSGQIGWDGTFVKDADGRGYTLEYAIPWALINASSRPPQAGDELAANWMVHWSDQKGLISRGHLTEITNNSNQPFRFLRGNTWGKAVFGKTIQQPSVPAQKR